MVEQTDFEALVPFVELESDFCEDNGHVFYQCESDLGISVLTDTTERSPTFSLHPFENQMDEKKNPSLSYLILSCTQKSEEAWGKLLGRSPRTVEWKELADIASEKRLKGFEFGKDFIKKRTSYMDKAAFKYFSIDQDKQNLVFELEQLKEVFPAGRGENYQMHLLLKLLLNAHSTVVMGRLGRYLNNVMTWVRPSNNKLVDRAIRYAQHLLSQKGVSVKYEQLAEKIFELKDKLPSDSPIVVALVESFEKN